MDAAYTEILSGGWAEKRMVDIAASAGVSRQTLYNVFGSKEGLLRAVLVRDADALLDRVAVLLHQDTGDPAHTVSRTTGHVLRAVGANPLLHAGLTGDRAILPALTIRSATLLDLLGERIAAMLGERCPDVDTSVTEAVADVSLRLLLSYALQPIDPDEAASRVESAVHGMLWVSSPESEGPHPVERESYVAGQAASGV